MPPSLPQAWRRWASGGGLQLEYQQSEKVKVPQIQFLERVLDTPVVPAMGNSQCTAVQKTSQEQGCGRRSCSDKFQRFVVFGTVQNSVDSARAVIGQGCLARCDARLVLWSRRAENCGRPTVALPGRGGGDARGDSTGAVLDGLFMSVGTCGELWSSAVAVR